MMSRQAKLVISILAVMLLASCAAYQPDTSYKPLDEPQLVRRADNFLILMDTSQSMATVPVFNGKSDLRRAWDIVTAINQTLPDAGFVATLATAGGGGCPFSQKTDVKYGPALWNRELFQEALEGVNRADGTAPVAKGLYKCVEELSYTSGNIALILVSDGVNQVGDSMAAAKALKGAYGDRICITAIQIGDEAEGRDVLAEVVEVGGCGILVDEKVFASAKGTDAFVKRVFFQQEARQQTIKCPVPKKAPAGVSEKTLSEPVTGRKPSLKKR